MNIFSAKIAALLAMLDANANQLHEPNYNQLFGRLPTPMSGSHYGSHNHGRGESKIRRKMAARSRRINRRK